uniref:Uncharacterized protein n=1 Tax=Oryza nivara TaxID=4536 RepID=A0A0E0JC18_ORYNI
MAAATSVGVSKRRWRLTRWRGTGLCDGVEVALRQRTALAGIGEERERQWCKGKKALALELTGDGGAGRRRRCPQRSNPP